VRARARVVHTANHRTPYRKRASLAAGALRSWRKHGDLPCCRSRAKERLARLQQRAEEGALDRALAEAAGPRTTMDVSSLGGGGGGGGGGGASGGPSAEARANAVRALAASKKKAELEAAAAQAERAAAQAELAELRRALAEGGTVNPLRADARVVTTFAAQPASAAAKSSR